jgi:hypothetical protein
MCLRVISQLPYEPFGKVFPKVPMGIHQTWNKFHGEVGRSLDALRMEQHATEARNESLLKALKQRNARVQSAENLNRIEAGCIWLLLHFRHHKCALLFSQLHRQFSDAMPMSSGPGAKRPVPSESIGG